MTANNQPGLRTLRVLVLASALAMAGAVESATITVDTATDGFSTDCTLRNAVSSANEDIDNGGCSAGSGADVIKFDASLDGQTIELTETGVGDNNNATGDLDISDANGEDLTIVGPTFGDPASITIDGSGADRVFDVLGGTVFLSSMTIQNGAGVRLGGGIQVRSTADELRIRDTVVRDNTVDSAGMTAGAAGGGVYAEAPLSIDESRIAGNQASTPGASSSDFTKGAGIAVNAEGPTEIIDTRVTDNVATSTNEDVYGGAVNIYHSGANPVIIDRSEISGNRVEFAGIDTLGGAVRVEADIFELRNSTISGNSATADSSVYGAALMTLGTPLQANNVTITANTATCDGDDCFGGIFAAVTSVEFSNSIIAENSASGGTNNAPDCGAINNLSPITVDFLGYNLLGDDTGCNFTATNDDQVGVDPMLAALADNGGPTLTHAPVDGSPAIDGGNPNPVADDTPPACEQEDQRQEARPADDDGDGGAVCDIGAFEGSVAAESDGGGGGSGGGGSGGGGGGGGGGGTSGPLMFALLGGVALARRLRRPAARKA